MDGQGVLTENGEVISEGQWKKDVFWKGKGMM